MTIHASPVRRYRRAPDMIARRIRGEHVLVPIRRTSASLDSIFTLNATAGFIWERAGEGLDPAAVARELAATYEIDEATAHGDSSARYATRPDRGHPCRASVADENGCRAHVAVHAPSVLLHLREPEVHAAMLRIGPA